MDADIISGTLDKWRNVSEERWDVVENFLIKDCGFELKGGKGSHFRFSHPLLREINYLFPSYLGQKFSRTSSLIVVQHKKRVTRSYLMLIVKIVEAIIEYKELKKREKI